MKNLFKSASTSGNPAKFVWQSEGKTYYWNPDTTPEQSENQWFEDKYPGVLGAVENGKDAPTYGVKEEYKKLVLKGNDLMELSKDFMKIGKHQDFLKLLNNPLSEDLFDYGNGIYGPPPSQSNKSE